MARREEDGQPARLVGPTLQELLLANKSYMRVRNNDERVSMMSCLNIHWRVMDMVNAIDEIPIVNRATYTKRVYRFVEDVCAVLTGKRGVHAVASLKMEAGVISVLLVEDKKVLVKMFQPVLERLSLDIGEKEEG